MTGLEHAYVRARDIIGPNAECLQVAAEVERLRLAWKPKRVRVILLAESHVWTSYEETQSRVMQPDGVETGFARFVYCIGYGESQLVTPQITANSGTPQYWRLFSDTLCDPTSVSYKPLMRAGEKSAQRRACNKLGLLKKMWEAGVWLIDASVTALFHPGNKLRLGSRLVIGSDYNKVLRACWELHIRDVLSDCAPSAVLIVGKGVESAIGDDVRRLGCGIEVEVINQPDAHLSEEAIGQDRRTCFNLCSKYLA